MLWTCVGHFLDIRWIFGGYVLDMFLVSYGIFGGRVLDMFLIFCGYLMDMVRVGSWQCVGTLWICYGHVLGACCIGVGYGLGVFGYFVGAFWICS